MTPSVHNLALVAKAMQYAFYAAASCHDKNYSDRFESLPGKLQIFDDFKDLNAQAYHGPMPTNIYSRWEEEARQVTEKLKTDAPFAAAYIALSERYIAMFEGVTPKHSDTPATIQNAFTKKCERYVVDLDEPVADGFTALNAPHLAAACRKLAL